MCNHLINATSLFITPHYNDLINRMVFAISSAVEKPCKVLALFLLKTSSNLFQLPSSPVIRPSIQSSPCDVVEATTARSL